MDLSLCLQGKTRLLRSLHRNSLKGKGEGKTSPNQEEKRTQIDSGRPKDDRIVKTAQFSTHQTKFSPCDLQPGSPYMISEPGSAFLPTDTP
jgi:hypothetical protein